MVVAETAGINEWLSTNEITDPACADAEWIKPDVTTTDVWYAFYLAQLIGSTTRLLPADHRRRHRRRARKPRSADAEPARSCWTFLGQDEGAQFGSNATAVGGNATSTGRGMVLGNPHFPWLGRYRFTQMHLTVPGKLDVAGGALTGFPAINIGFNKDVAWSHTVSTGYRFTPYQYTTAGTPTSYQTPTAAPPSSTSAVVEVPVKTDDGVETVTRTLYRTPQGYVLSAPSNFMSWTKQQLLGRSATPTPSTCARSTRSCPWAWPTSVRDLLNRQDQGGGMPWVNTIAADRAGDVAVRRPLGHPERHQRARARSA